MWFFKKREKQNIIKLIGFTDYHSHILPGVDDGVQTMDESLEILRLYEEQGIKSVWLTPHIMEDIPNTTAHLRDRFAELQAAYTGGVQLHLAAENMLDNLFEERLGKNVSDFHISLIFICWLPVSTEAVRYVSSVGYW